MPGSKRPGPEHESEDGVDQSTQKRSDGINSIFEALGGAFIVLSIIQAVVDKSVAGVSLGHVGFFVVWGYWNLYYYKAIKQRFSLIASIGVTVANTVWLALLIYYKWGA
jgi:hypothetical protein